MKTKDLVIMALLISLSIILSFAPPIYGTIGFDSLPAFVALLYFKNYYGGIIASLAHLLSAMLKGFFFGLPVHIAIAILMGVLLYTAIPLIKKSPFLAFIYILIGNAFVMPLILFVFGMPFSIAAYTTVVSPLVIAVSINYGVAYIIYMRLEKVSKHA